MEATGCLLGRSELSNISSLISPHPSSTFGLTSVPVKAGYIYAELPTTFLGRIEKMRIDDDKIIEDKKTPPIVHAVSHEGEARKGVEKTGVNPRHPHTIRYLERKLEEWGVYRMERHPGDGRGVKEPPPKSGHGGKYTWEGPDDLVESELKAAPPAIDEKDPNFGNEEKFVKGEEEESDVAGLVAGEIEVAKVAEEREGVASIEVDPHLELEGN